MWSQKPRKVKFNGHVYLNSKSHVSGRCRGYAPKIWHDVVQYLHSRVWNFPLIQMVTIYLRRSSKYIQMFTESLPWKNKCKWAHDLWNVGEDTSTFFKPNEIVHQYMIYPIFVWYLNVIAGEYIQGPGILYVPRLKNWKLYTYILFIYVYVYAMAIKEMAIPAWVHIQIKHVLNMNHRQTPVPKPGPTTSLYGNWMVLKI